MIIPFMETLALNLRSSGLLLLFASEMIMVTDTPHTVLLIDISVCYVMQCFLSVSECVCVRVCRGVDGVGDTTFCSEIY